jgi:hypothetical protein
MIIVQDVTIVGAKSKLIGTKQTTGGFCVTACGLGYC